MPKKRTETVYENSAEIEAFRQKSLTFDMDNAFTVLLRRMYAASNLHFQQRTADPDVTPIQMGILLLVFREEIVGIRELARRMSIDRSTMQEVVQRLVKRGLIRRKAHPNDRRTFQLNITKDGLAVLQRNFNLMKGLEASFLDGVAPEDVQVVKKVFVKVLACMDEEATAPSC